MNKEHQHRFLTRWDEELYNDKMSIVTRNPYTDFVLEPARKRQRVVCHGPWYEPSAKTMHKASKARWISTTKLRKDMLADGFNHWRRLAYAGYPQPRPGKLIEGLKGLAREVGLFREKERIVLAAKRDWFAAVYCADQ